MFESLLHNQQLGERSLTRLRLFDKVVYACETDGEWKTIDSVAKFLSIFKSATAVLSGSQYSPASLVLLFRPEICGALADDATDCSIIKSMKHNMRGAVSKRFPVEELHVVAAILDPSQRNLTAVQNNLTQNAVNAVDVLY
jgi:hypothetical protein